MIVLPAPLILGSTSKYRAELLHRLRVGFSQVKPLVDETPALGESPLALAKRLALAKADAVAKKHPDAIVIGCDQVADRGGQCVGKAGSREAAIADLQRSSGQVLIFHSAVCVRFADKTYAYVDDTACQFRTLTQKEIAAYVDAEQPWDCAGSIKSEGLGINLLERIDSHDPTAIIGLGLIQLARVLRELATRGSLPGQTQ